jgi:hypothetical protein
MSDGPCNWSKIFWCFAGNLFADLNLHRCDSCVAYDRKERGWWAPFVVPLDPAGVVAADHGVASQAGGLSLLSPRCSGTPLSFFLRVKTDLY